MEVKVIFMVVMLWMCCAEFAWAYMEPLADVGDPESYNAPIENYDDSAAMERYFVPQKRNCKRRGQRCNYWGENECCGNGACKCNIWGQNCKCSRPGLFCNLGIASWD